MLSLNTYGFGFGVLCRQNPQTVVVSELLNKHLGVLCMSNCWIDDRYQVRAMARRQLTSLNSRFFSTPSNFPSGFATFSSKATPYQGNFFLRVYIYTYYWRFFWWKSVSGFENFSVKVGIPEFLKGVGKGVETYAEKLETGIGDFQKLLVTRTLKLKQLGVESCKHVIILQYPFSNNNNNNNGFLAIY